MRPIPVYLITGIAAALAALPSAAQVATHAYSSPAGNGVAGTGTTGTTTTGTTTSTGTTTATTGTSGTTTTSSTFPGMATTPAATNQSTYTPAGGASTTNAANGAPITGTTTSFGNGAQYVVNADGTVTVLGSVPTVTTTNSSTPATGTSNTLAASVNGTGAFTGTTTTLNPLVADVNGTAPGQTSSGTAAGNSSLGIVDANGTLASVNAGNGYVPGVSGVGGYVGSMAAVDYGAMADAGSGVNANGERVASLGGAGSTINITNNARTPTPTFDMAARAGMAKELNRRAKGQSPRIIGIAPRTNVDRTDQMPDDPVIRY